MHLPSRHPISQTRHGFSIGEWLAAMAILTLLITLATELCNHARRVALLENQHLDADAQARAVLDRMSIDFAHLVARRDVDYWLKDKANPQPGNDQIAFYSQVPGYYPSSGSQSPVSLVGYRVDATAGLQRFGCGLVWNSVPGSEMPMVFSSQSASSGDNMIARHWPAATNREEDSRFEPAGPSIFRLEYYYIINSDGTGAPSVLSSVPWDTRAPGNHTSVDGLADVAAIGVIVAAIDPKARAMISPEAFDQLAQSLADFSESAAAPGEIEALWQNAITASGLPRAVTSAIRIYRRCFPLPAASRHSL